MRRLLACMIFILVATAGAQEFRIRLRADEPPRMTLEDGKPIRATWPDGRVAVMLEEILAIEPFRVSMPYNGSNCASTPAPICKIEGPIRFRKMFFVWESNPVEPSRIGKMLERVNSETGVPDGLYGFHVLVTQDTQMTWRQLGLRNALGEELKTRIQCDRFDWLPSAPGGTTLRRVSVPAWITNFETPVLEFDIPGVEDNSAINQYTAAAKYTTLKKSGRGTYLVEDMESFATTVLGHGTMLRGYTTRFYFDRSAFLSHPQKINSEEKYPNPGCEIEFTLSFAEFFAQNNARFAIEVRPDYDRSRARIVRYHFDDPQAYVDPESLVVEGMAH